MYIEYLANFRFNPSDVHMNLTDENGLEIRIKGPWHRTILWEVPLMALICECYSISNGSTLNLEGYREKTLEKMMNLDSNLSYADFGTRRRYSHYVQDMVVRILTQSESCVGTSNMYLAKKYNVKAIGTLAHEFFMGVSALESLRYSNRVSMKRWHQTYDGRLGIILTDTYGVDDFLKHFDNFNARLFDGVRHDSGDPFTFTDKIVNHYKSLGIDPTSKTIVFSDGLNVEKALEIANYCDGKVRCSFGIGTHFTNDTDEALNIVIKLRTVNGIDVVKLSDNPIKATGEDSAVAVAMSVFHGKKIALCE